MTVHNQYYKTITAGNICKVYNSLVVNCVVEEDPDARRVHRKHSGYSPPSPNYGIRMNLSHTHLPLAPRRRGLGCGCVEGDSIRSKDQWKWRELQGTSHSTPKLCIHGRTEPPTTIQGWIQAGTAEGGAQTLLVILLRATFVVN